MILYIEKKMGMYGCWSPSIKIFCAITTGGFECAGIWLITRTATPVTAAVNRITRTIFSQKCGTGALALISKASGFLVLPVPIAYKLLTSIAGKRPQVGNKVYVFFFDSRGYVPDLWHMSETVGMRQRFSLSIAICQDCRRQWFCFCQFSPNIPHTSMQ